MIHENFIFIIEAAIIVIETIVLIFLIYHFRELHKSTILAHEEITTMKEAISEMHTFIRELHEETTIAHEQIDTMKKILSEIYEVFKGTEKQKK